MLHHTPSTGSCNQCSITQGSELYTVLQNRHQNNTYSKKHHLDLIFFILMNGPESTVPLMSTQVAIQSTTQYSATDSHSSSSIRMPASRAVGSTQLHRCTQLVE